MRGNHCAPVTVPAIDHSGRATVVDRETWLAACDDLLTREKAHTREGDAIAAARRRLPMTEVLADVTVVGADGRIPFVDAFEGRRQLIGYFHMWHDGKPWEQQCEGCTFFTAQVQRPPMCTAAMPHSRCSARNVRR